MYRHETKVRVRYSETDQMQYVYYGNYAQYFEVARVEAMRYLGVSYKTMEQRGVIMPVLELNVKYFRPARYDDLLTIKTNIPKLPEVKIFFEYEVYNEANTLLVKGATTLVFVDTVTGKPVEAPEMLMEKIGPYFNEPVETGK